ncbi:hypothetical protein [Pseudomarimonas arenosa]|uniref:Uncharacterized protein n=1 Tax=Pseudomarimonas arenosa TaxID=2774145 RepID=A0AAW3ZNB5_9GAMM|nr:hypothetical protein [Pseudomarimonas arenosa]MBD8527625.1 hypothetical protein [Pseudomarimonas arenosa]
MDGSSQCSFAIAAIYVAGAFGLVGITLLPLRSWTLLQRNLCLLSDGPNGKAAFVMLLLSAILAIGLSVEPTFKVVKCLLGYHCSGNRAGGWLFLSMIGLFYLLFEAVAFTVIRLAKLRSRAET